MTERRGKKCKQINTYFNDKINGSSSYIKHNYTWYIKETQLEWFHIRMYLQMGLRG